MKQDAAEFLFVARRFVGAVVGVARAHARLERGRITDLGFVFQQRPQFDLPGVADIQNHVRLGGQGEPDLARGVRLEALCQQFGEVVRIAGSREDGIQDDLTGGAVVGVVQPIAAEGKEVGRVAGDQDVGPFLAEDAHHLAAQFQRWDEVAILVVEKADFPSADDIGSAAQPVEVDAFGHRMKGGAGDSVARLITEHLNLKARVDRPNYLQRCFMACASPVDIEEAYQVGRTAVRAAVTGQSDRMVSLVRASSRPYECTTGLVDLASVANAERLLPEEYLDRTTGEIRPAFVEYAAPLIGDPLPPYARLPLHFI